MLASGPTCRANLAFVPASSLPWLRGSPLRRPTTRRPRSWTTSPHLPAPVLCNAVADAPSPSDFPEEFPTSSDAAAVLPRDGSSSSLDDDDNDDGDGDDDDDDGDQPMRAATGATGASVTADTDSDMDNATEDTETVRATMHPVEPDDFDGTLVCIGEFLHSPSLTQYAEQRDVGLMPPALEVPIGDWADTWALSVSEQKGPELRNQYSRVGILIESNFFDFVPADGCTEAYKNATLDEIALVKARAVYEATGMPAIAEANDMSIDAPPSDSGVNKTLQQEYYTRAVAEEGDTLIERVRPVSDENRMVRFGSAAVYYDGTIEVLTRGKVSTAMVFCSASKGTIATASALDELYKALTRRFGLELDEFRSSGVNEGGEDGEEGKVLVGATLLKERIMRDGKMLSDGIIKVSSFLNHMVDTDLMEVCGEELAERLRSTMPNKLLTVESTGLIVGLPTARKLGIPLVFARKSRPITISDSYQTTYRSATKGTTNELIVSCEYLESGDRVLIIDDFLAGGSTAEALFKLANMAHAKVVGVGVLIEKMSEGGRTFLSGYDVPVESLAKILPEGPKGSINLMEEEPWVSPYSQMSKKEVARQAATAQAEYYSKTAEPVSAASDVGPLGIDEDFDGDLVDEGEDDEDEADEDGVDVLRWEEDESLDELEEALIREENKLR